MSAGKKLNEASDVHKVIFIKNLAEYSDYYSRTVLKDEFWYLDNDATTVTSNAVTNLRIRARALLSHDGTRFKTVIPLNRHSFFEELEDKFLPPIQLEFEIELQNNSKLIF